MAEPLLPGDAIERALRDARASGTTLDVRALPVERERGSLDPQTVAEFLAYDIEFREEPATGFGFPPEVGVPPEAER